MIKAIETLEAKIETIKGIILEDKDKPESIKIEYREIVEQHKKAIKVLKSEQEQSDIKSIKDELLNDKIKEAAKADYDKQTKYDNSYDRQKGFVEGVKWMRGLIGVGNKEVVLMVRRARKN